MPSETPKHMFVVASAGSGKTTYLIEEALKIKDRNVLITTYTEANDGEIRNKIVERNRAVPKNVFIQTWFSMLLQHGVRPYQGYFIGEDITGMHLAQGQSASYIKESDVKKHYFDSKFRIYSDKLSKFFLKCNEASKGKVISRLSRIYSHIFIDEVQDLAGHDLELVRLLCSSSINVILVGDPRQGTFSTSNSKKNKKYRRSALLQYFEEKPIVDLTIQDNLLVTNHRSLQVICDLADSLFPEFGRTTSGNSTAGNHAGIFLVRPGDVEKYLSSFSPVILRDSKRTSVSPTMPVMNFGASKGLTFDRVLIYPTKPIVDWLKNNENDLAPVSRSKLYVAITRARYSVAFVYDYSDSEVIESCQKFSLNQS